MAVTLQMSFATELGKTVTLSIPEPKPGLTEAEVRLAMQAIIDKDVFTSASGSFIEIKAAKVVDRDVTPIFPVE